MNEESGEDGPPPQLRRFRRLRFCVSRTTEVRAITGAAFALGFAFAALGARVSEGAHGGLEFVVMTCRATGAVFFAWFLTLLMLFGLSTKIRFKIVVWFTIAVASWISLQLVVFTAMLVVHCVGRRGHRWYMGLSVTATLVAAAVACFSVCVLRKYVKGLLEDAAHGTSVRASPVSLASATSAAPGGRFGFARIFRGSPPREENTDARRIDIKPSKSHSSTALRRADSPVRKYRQQLDTESKQTVRLADIDHDHQFQAVLDGVNYDKEELETTVNQPVFFDKNDERKTHKNSVRQSLPLQKDDVVQLNVLFDRSHRFGNVASGGSRNSLDTIGGSRSCFKPSCSVSSTSKDYRRTVFSGGKDAGAQLEVLFNRSQSSTDRRLQQLYRHP